MADKKSIPAELGRTLDALLAHTPDRTTWRAIAALLDCVPAPALPAISKKVAAGLARWPLGLRSMPQGWWEAIVTGRDEPRAALARRRTLWTCRDDDDEQHLDTYALQVDVSPDLSTFVTADAAEWHHNGGDIVLWDGLTGRPRKVLLSGRDYHGEAYSVLYSPDGRWIAAAPVETGAVGSLRMWNASSGELVWTQELAPKKMGAAGLEEGEGAAEEEGASEMIALDFTPDSKRIWSASRRLGRLRCWDVATGASRSELPDEPGVTAIRVSPKSRLLATGTDKGWLRVWDLKDESLLAETPVGEKAIWSVAFTADGKKVASAGRTVDLWTIDVETLVKEEGHPVGARGDAIAGGFSLVALGSGGIRAASVVHGGVNVRDVPGRKVRRIKLQTGIESIRLSRDGRVLIAGNTRRVRVFWL